ncbi:hypothetical protein [Cellvibrio sp. KY-YJ-3]|uniref:hypothetical protein n=1 Tax=Cellvibrio sp. KY-YJ-3 TaxID=454662 RepID=UPI0012460312|nr:hypothetical protein [Cellvibrio sp. KY-YJ-3]QEY11183.1 hypothetical protein D0B88_02275 [Cellvibrio sp. KY-YJ-3]
MLFKYGVILSIINLLLSCGNTQLTPMESAFFVNDTSIVEGCEKSETKQLEIACHRLVPLTGRLVIANRIYERGREPSFTKVTISLPDKIENGDIFNFSSPDTRLFYSAASSFLPGKSGCFGFAKSGTLIIRQITAETIIVDLSVVVETASPLGWKGICGNISLKKQFTVHHRNYEELSPWDGVKKEDTEVMQERVAW